MYSKRDDFKFGEIMSIWLKKNHYDVVIKGGGIAGVSLAYWLNKINPSLQVAIWELNYMGSGATGRNAGFLTCGSLNYFKSLVDKFGENTALEIWSYYRENHEQLKPFTKDCDYQPQGATTFSTSDKEVKTLEEVYNKYNQKLPLSLVSSSNFLMGVKYEKDASIHPLKLLKNLNSQISADWLIGDNALENVSYDYLIHATNGFTNLTNIPITAQRGQIILYKPSNINLEGLGYNTENLCYFKKLPTGEFLLGGARSIDLETEQTNVLGENVKITNHLQDFAYRYFNLDPNSIQNKWSGIMGFTPDHQPLVGQINKKEAICAGFSGHGMGIAFMAAKVLSENIINQKSIPQWMDVQRFLKGV